MPQSDLTFAIAMPIGAWHPLLPAALRSLAAQDPHPELAVMDASGDPRVTEALDDSGLSFAYRRHGPDAGQCAAIMEGWRNTRSDVVGWLNADDLLLAGALAEAGAALDARPDAGGVFAGSVILDAAWAVPGVHGPVEPLTGLIARSNPISQPSCFVRRQAMEAVGGLDETLHYVMDWDFWIRLHESGHALEPVGALWSSVYWGEGTKTSQLGPRRAGEIFSLTRKRAGALNALKTVLSMRLEQHGMDWLFRLSRSGRADRGAGGVRITAARHPGERGRTEARLRIPNAFAASRSRLVVKLSTDEAAVSADAAKATKTAPGRWTLAFAEEVRPGADRRITLTAPDRTTVRFVSAQWCD